MNYILLTIVFCTLFYYRRVVYMLFKMSLYIIIDSINGWQKPGPLARKLAEPYAHLLPVCKCNHGYSHHKVKKRLSTDTICIDGCVCPRYIRRGEV